MDDEIDLRDVFRVLWNNRLLIIGIFMAAVIVAGVACFALPPTYRTSSVIALGNFEDPIYTNQTSARLIMLSDEFLSEVYKQLKPNMNVDEFGNFMGSVKIEPVKVSDNLLSISVDTQDSQEGKRVIEKIVSLFSNRSDGSYWKQKDMLSKQLADTKDLLAVLEEDMNKTNEAIEKIENAREGSTSEIESKFLISFMQKQLINEEFQRYLSVLDSYYSLQNRMDNLRHLEVIQPPTEPTSPVWPRKTLIMAVAGMLGLMIGIFAAFLREGFRRPVD